MTPPEAFELLESILWRPGRGYFLLRRHVTRLQRTARVFGFHPVSRVAVGRDLDTALMAAAPSGPVKIRLLVDVSGRTSVSVTPLSVLTPPSHATWKVAVARQPVDERDPFLRHKTTCRTVYDRARAEHPGVDDVLLWNRRGEVTETTLANVIFDFGDGQSITPAAGCGLLPGVFREQLLAAGRIREAVIPLEDFQRRQPKITLINSVRRYIPAEIASVYGS